MEKFCPFICNVNLRNFFQVLQRLQEGNQMLQGIEMDPVRMLNSQMILMLYMSTLPVPC